MLANQANHLRTVGIEDQVSVRNRDLSGEIERLHELFSSLSASLDNLLNFSKPDVSTGVDFYQEVTRFECSLIEQSLKLAGGCQRRAAEMLNLRPTTLNNKIKVYDIDLSNIWIRPSHRPRNKTTT